MPTIERTFVPKGCALRGAARQPEMILKNKRSGKEPPSGGGAGKPSGPLFPDPRQEGVRAFQAGRFDTAIMLWSRQAADPAVQTALAETYFRRALLRSDPRDRLLDLKMAVALAPGDARYRYHLGMALHRQNDLAGAITEYRAALHRNPALDGVALALAVATLEQNPRADLSTLPGYTPAIQAALAPPLALIRGTPLPETAEDTLGRLWRVLDRIRAADREAAPAFNQIGTLGAGPADQVRQYYKGVAAALAGNREEALGAWQRAWAAGLGALSPWLSNNLSAAALELMIIHRAAGHPERAAAVAEAVKTCAVASPALAEAVVVTLDEAARAAAASGEWGRAARLWEEARTTVTVLSTLGSPRPLYHNLALAYEAQEQWTEAADAWRAMLRTRPRKTPRATESAAPADLDAAQWAWVRKRIIECYRKAGTPGEAVAVFRQAIKADPDDLDLRLELAAALEANEQDQAAKNELGRILEIDPHHVAARLQLVSLILARGEWYYAQSTIDPLLKNPPADPGVRRRIAQAVIELGQRHQNFGMLDAAAQFYEKGQELAPTDYQFPMLQARVAAGRGDRAAVQTLLARALELAEDRPDAYSPIVEVWMAIGDLEQARAVIAQAARTLTLTPDFYIHMAVDLLRHARQDAAPPGLAGLLGVPAKKPLPPADSPWQQLGVELLARAEQHTPNNADVLTQIAAALLTLRPDLAIRYAEKAFALAPDSVDAIVHLALLQALNGQGKEGRETLKRATALARRTGRHEELARIEELRRVIDSPMLPMILQMGPMLDEFDLDPEDFF